MRGLLPVCSNRRGEKMKAAMWVLEPALAAQANALVILAEVYPGNHSIVWYVGERTLYSSFWNCSQAFEMDECHFNSSSFNPTFHFVPEAAPNGKPYCYTTPYAVPNGLGAQNSSENSIVVCAKNSTRMLIQSFVYFPCTSERRPEGYSRKNNYDCTSGVCGMRSRQCEKNVQFCRRTRSGECAVHSAVPGMPETTGQYCSGGDLIDVCGRCGRPSDYFCDPGARACVPLKSGSCMSDADCSKRYNCYLITYAENECRLNETVVKTLSYITGGSGTQQGNGGVEKSFGWGCCLSWMSGIMIFVLGVPVGRRFWRKK